MSVVEPDSQAAERVLVELLQLEREIVELEYVRRTDALERVHEAVRRLGEVGSARGILDRAAEELGASSEFERFNSSCWDWSSSDWDCNSCASDCD